MCVCLYQVGKKKEVLRPYRTRVYGLETRFTRRKKISPKNKKDLGMACHIPTLKKVKKQGEMPLPSLGPIPLKKYRI